ncbi:MAG: Sphingobium phage Lacusarx [Planctomycetota bacterium]
MSKSNAFEQSLLELLFNNSNIANVGDATGLRGSSTAGSLYIALHTSDPGEAGSQTTNECAYTSYARQSVARSVAGFTISGNTASLAANVDFPEATGGSETATHFSIGTSSSGAGSILYKGSITPTVAIS